MESQPDWVEFTNNPDCDAIGRSISALANAAALHEKEYAYLICGVDGSNDAAPQASCVRRELLENESRLRRKLTPQKQYQVVEMEAAGGIPVLLVQIPAASSLPVRYDGVEWVKDGLSVRHLQDFPETERRLWRMLDKEPLASRLAASSLQPDQVLDLLSSESFLRRQPEPRPKTRDELLRRMELEGIVVKNSSGFFAVTHLGAVCFVQKLSSFPSLARKAFRIVKYVDDSRLHTEKEFLWDQGCAVDFEGLMRLIKALPPGREVIDGALRREICMYPEIIIRELLLNALVHQDFRITGAGPMLEIFRDRIEITNPGRPLVEVDHLIDSPPRSRNEDLAALMHSICSCEERGSGIDKVAAAAEHALLPAPEFELAGENFKVVLCARKSFKDYSTQEKEQIC